MSPVFWEVLADNCSYHSRPSEEISGVDSGVPGGDDETEGGGVEEHEDVGFRVLVVGGGGCVGGECNGC